MFHFMGFPIQTLLFLGNYESQKVPAQWGTASELVTLYLKTLVEKLRLSVKTF